MRAADAPLAVPDGARPPLQLRDLVDEADALDERPTLPAPAARPRALGHLLLLTEGEGAEEKEGKQSQEQCGEGRCPHGRRPDVFGVVDSRDKTDCSRGLLEVLALEATSGTVTSAASDGSGHLIRHAHK